MSITKSKHFRVPLIAAALLAASQPATAMIRCYPSSGPGAIAVPNTIDGIYLNFVTGVTGATARDVPGWDFNPFKNGNNALAFFTPSAETNRFGTLATGFSGNTAEAQALRNGAFVGPNPSPGFYNRSITRATNFHSVGRSFVGVSLFNEALGIINYGWVELVTGDGTGSDAGFPATIVQFCYEDSGVGTSVGFVPVELQHFSID